MWYIYGIEAGGFVLGFGDVALGILYVKNPHDALKFHQRNDAKVYWIRNDKAGINVNLVKINLLARREWEFI